MKWLCGNCKSINATGAFECHNCKQPASLQSASGAWQATNEELGLMNPTQANNDEKKEEFPRRVWIEEICHTSLNTSHHTLLFGWSCHNAGRKQYLSLEEHQHILSEERARLESVVMQLKEAANDLPDWQMEHDRMNKLARKILDSLGVNYA